jgi:hypothetical protein
MRAPYVALAEQVIESFWVISRFLVSRANNYPMHFCGSSLWICILLRILKVLFAWVAARGGDRPFFWFFAQDG